MYQLGTSGSYVYIYIYLNLSFNFPAWEKAMEVYGHFNICRGRINFVRGWNVVMFGCFGKPPPLSRHPLHYLPADVRTSAEVKVVWPLQLPRKPTKNSKMDLEHV